MTELARRNKNATLEPTNGINAHRQGADPGCSNRGGGGARDCVHPAHIPNVKRKLKSLMAGVQGSLKGPKSSRVQVLSHTTRVFALF